MLATADAAACSKIGRDGGIERLIWITEKGGPRDPTTQQDAGGNPASQLLPSYRKNLRSHRPRFCGIFSPATGQTRARANSAVSGSSVPDQEVGPGHGQSVRVRIAFLNSAVSRSVTSTVSA